MSDQRISFCYTRYTDGLCGKPVTPGLPVCSDCLRRILDEDDPRHRRTLAASPQLAIGLVHRLADDPDDGVRAQIAARTDLDTPTGNLLGNPDRESSPVVWRSLASGSGAVAHAWELLGTDDPDTLAILAANPDVDPDVLEQLARHSDPDVAWTASATLQHQPPSQAIVDRIAAARSYDGLPLDELVVPVSSAPLPAPPAAPRTVPVTTNATATSRSNEPPGGSGQGTLTRPAPPETTSKKHAGLLVGVVAAGVAIVIIVAIVLTRGGSGSKPTDFGMGPPLTGTARTLGPGETSTTSTTRPPTTTPTTPPTTQPAPTTTVPPTQPPPQTQPGPVVPDQPGPITQSFQILPGTGQFCATVQITVNFSPSPGYVVVTDDSGAQVAAWSGASGQTQTAHLSRPTSVLSVTVTATGSSISVSGSASGGSC